jgi:hypothetical protein
MSVNTLKNFLPILGLVLVLVIVSMMVISYFNVNMNETGGLRTLNRVAIHENMTNIENMDTINSLLQEGNVGLMETQKR